MTPAALYEAVKPLWERDAGFNVPGLDYSPGGSMFQPSWSLDPPAVEKDDTYCTDELLAPTAAALIRDRIVERLDELGCNVEQGRTPLPRPDGHRMATVLSRRTGLVYSGFSDDRTLALIEAAMRATAPAAAPSP